MKILITGGAGFVGSHLVDYFIKNYNYEIIVLDNMSYAAYFDNIKLHIEYNSIKFVLGDVYNYSLYLVANGVYNTVYCIYSTSLDYS